MPGQFQGRPDGLLAGTEDRPPPGGRERFNDLQAMARLGLRIPRRHRRRRARLVGDHADQPAGLKAPAQLDARGPGIFRIVPRGRGASVPYRVGGQLGRDNDGVLGQLFQPPLVQGGHGKLTGRPGRLRHRVKLKAAPPGHWWRQLRRRWLPGTVAIASGPRGSRGTSLVHGSTTEPEVGHALGQRIRYDATSGVQMQVHLHRPEEVATEPAQRRPGNRPVQFDGGRKTRRWPACCRRK